MKAFKFKIFGNEYSVNIQEVEGQTIKLEVNGSEYVVEMEKSVKTTKTPTLVRSQIKSVASPTQNTLATNASVKKITAPLPGVILELKIREGDGVKTGDVLLIMEAMKMENNILAEGSGVVKRIHVAKGSTVLQGDLLIEIE